MAKKTTIKKLSEEEASKDRQIVLDFINTKAGNPNRKPSKPGPLPTKLSTEAMPVGRIPVASQPMPSLKTSKTSSPQTKKLTTEPLKTEVPSQINQKTDVAINLQKIKKTAPRAKLSKNRPAKLDRQQLSKLEAEKKIFEEKLAASKSQAEKNKQIVKKIKHTIKHRNYKQLLKLIFLISLALLIVFFAAYAFFWLILNAISLS